jgi:predicted ester cyclase
MDAQTAEQTRISPEHAGDWFERFKAGWNSHDAEQLLALATEEVVWEDPFTPEGALHGKEAVREWLRSTWTAMPDLEFEWVGEPFVSLDGTQLACAWRGVGHFTGPLDPPGFRPTGGRVEMSGVDIHEFEGDLVRHVVTLTDAMAVGRQIGAAPAPGSGAERFGVLMQRLAARRLRRQSA